MANLIGKNSIASSTFTADLTDPISSCKPFYCLFWGCVCYDALHLAHSKHAAKALSYPARTHCLQEHLHWLVHCAQAVSGCSLLCVDFWHFCTPPSPCFSNAAGLPPVPFPGHARFSVDGLQTPRCTNLLDGFFLVFSFLFYWCPVRCGFVWS